MRHGTGPNEAAPRDPSIPRWTRDSAESTPRHQSRRDARPRAKRSRSAPLPSLPDFFARPLPSPLRGHVRVVRGRAFRWTKLHEILDVEAARPQQADPVAIPEAEIHRGVSRPLEPVEPEVRSHQAVGRRFLTVRRAQVQDRSVHQELKPAAGPEQARRLGNPAIRVGPDARAVFGDRESKLASGRGTVSALPWISGNSIPCSACSRRAVASCASELSMPTGRAPRRASHAEM